jgi:hypothetical protein
MKFSTDDHGSQRGGCLPARARGLVRFPSPAEYSDTCERKRQDHR